MNHISNIPNDYPKVIQELKKRIIQSRSRSILAINRELIQLYWDLGKIVSEKTKLGWGTNTVEQLAIDLQGEFQGVKGFSASNIWRMKNFYESYINQPKLAQLVRELPWGHNLVLIEKIKDNEERVAYANMVIEKGWSRKTLLDNITNDTYQQYIKNQNNFIKTIDENKLAELKWESLLIHILSCQVKYLNTYLMKKI